MLINICKYQIPSSFAGKCKFFIRSPNTLLVCLQYAPQNTPNLQNCSSRNWPTTPESFKLQKSALKLRSHFFSNLQSSDPEVISSPIYNLQTQSLTLFQCHIRYKQYVTVLFHRAEEAPWSFHCSHIPGLSGFGATGSFDGCPCCLLDVLTVGSFFSLEMFVPDDFFMTNPSIATLDSSALVFFTLCFGVPKGEENWTESC